MATNPLRGVLAKIERADHHIDYLHTVIAPFCNPGSEAVTHTDDLETRQRVYHLRREMEIDPKVSAIIGDIVHNLRSSLDHLGFALCLAGPKAAKAPEMDRLFFPIGGIDEPPHTFPDRVAGCIQGFWKPDAVKALYRIEPYQGGKSAILSLLSHLDITDKHRLLVTVAAKLRSTDFGNYMKAQVVASKIKRGDLESAAALSRMDLSAFFGDDDPACPLKPSDPLFTDSIDSVVDEHFKARLDIAIHEPQIIKCQPISPLLQDMIDFVRSVVVPTFEEFC